MIATSFDESDAVLHPPEGMSADDCSALSIRRVIDPEGRVVVCSCWKVTPEELAEINRTGRVWLLIWGETMPPACLSGLKPFVVPDDEAEPIEEGAEG